MIDGFIPLFRKLEENFVWDDNELLAIWIRLLFKANFIDKPWFNGFEVVTIKRGSFVTSNRKIGELLRLSNSTARRRLELFVNHEMLELRVERKYTIVTICNYEKYLQLFKNYGTQSEVKGETEMKRQWNAGETLVKTREVKEVKKTNKYNGEVQEIIGDLNQVLGTSYTTTRVETVKHINARLDEGFTVEDFKAVHRLKKTQWFGTDMAKHLTPTTLYRPSHFEKYVNELKIGTKPTPGKTIPKV